MNTSLYNAHIIPFVPARMSSDELSHFALGESLAGRSEVLQRKAIHRIYGEKAGEIIEGTFRDSMAVTQFLPCGGG